MNSTKPNLENSLVAQFDHVISHFDGNNNDLDDIAALPMAAMLTNAAGLQDKSTFFHSNNLGEPNNSYQVEAMRESAAFAEKLGIKTYDYQANTDTATAALVDILNSGKKVLAIEGGPMEAIYRALEQVSPENYKNITLLSHSSWNENRNKASRPGVTDVRTWSDIASDFPEVELLEIRDQNGSKDTGFNNPKWTWLDNATDPVLQEARELMENAKGKVNDPSDSGMHFYAITGEEAAEPIDAQAFFAEYPPTFSISSPPAPIPDSGDDIFLAQDGQVVLEAESAALQGDWKTINVGSETAVLWDADKSSYGKPPSGQTLEYLFETDESGTYSIAMRSGRVKSAMNNSDRYENGDSGKERTDTGNDAYVSIINNQTGEVIQKPTKLFTGLGNTNQELKWGQTFDANHQKSPAQVKLDANTQYRLEVTGRSDGYMLDRITLSNDGFLKDADASPSPIKGETPNPSPDPNPNPNPDPNPEPAITRVEAEDMQLSGEYGVESIGVASGGKGISLIGGPSDETGTATLQFDGADGVYDIKIAYFDENDGVGKLEVMQGDRLLETFELNEQLGSRLADSKTLTTQDIKGVTLEAGDTLSIKGFEDGTSKTAEHARVDYVEFTPVELTSPDTPDTNSANDILNGVNFNLSNPGVAEGDMLLGNTEADTFVLGNANSTFYSSKGDLAMIEDFQLGEDVIQLQGSAEDYQLITSGSQTNIYEEAGSTQNEFIGVVSGAADGLSVSGNELSVI